MLTLITRSDLCTLTLRRASHPAPFRVPHVDIEIFSAAWPQGMPLTRATLTRAVALGLDIRWFLALIPLTRDAQAVLTCVEDDAWAAYVRAEAATTAAYRRANKAGGHLRAVQARYRRARVTSWRAYTQVVTEAQIEALLVTLADTGRTEHTAPDKKQDRTTAGSQPEP